MDETAFETRKKSKKVVALRGSANVWNTDVTTNFHLTVVVCGSADGSVVPPLFILPGKTVRLDMLDGCDVSGAAVTTTESAFMNARLFEQWLRFFANAVPALVCRPLLLVMDVCSSHYRSQIIETACALHIFLVCMPSNATDLFQPLDVAVFGLYKGKLRCPVNEFVGGSGNGTLYKATAIRLAGFAWTSCNFSANIKAGFQACGLYPLSLPRMFDCMGNFERNGAPAGTRIAEWLRIKDVVQDSLLVLPPPKQKQSRKRITATVGGKLLTRECDTRFRGQAP